MAKCAYEYRVRMSLTRSVDSGLDNPSLTKNVLLLETTSLVSFQVY